MKLGTSTPRADPSGDYAWEVFRKADALRPGAGATLEKKALQLTGGPTSAPPPQGRAVYGWHVAEGRADIFLTYCTNAMDAQKQNPDQQIVALPDALAVGADYGLTVMNGSPPPPTCSPCTSCRRTASAFWRSTGSTHQALSAGRYGSTTTIPVKPHAER